MLNIVIVEDHSDLRESLLDVMVANGHEAVAFDSAEALWSGCNLVGIDIMILDLNLPARTASPSHVRSGPRIRRSAS
jgi:DNA-binding response OmpR family regulator